MTLKQSILKIFYPLIMKLSKPKAKQLTNTNSKMPPSSFYSLSAQLNNGKQFSFEELRGKKVLIVNTASNCGYTAQYGPLQELYEKYKNELTIIGFPANDFKEQEQADDATIAQFCSINYGVTFPLALKSSVIKSTTQNPVFTWLSDPGKNGWCDKAPEWNFSKYLVNESGILTNYFAPGISPTDAEIENAILAQ